MKPAALTTRAAGFAFMRLWTAAAMTPLWLGLRKAPDQQPKRRRR